MICYTLRYSGLITEDGSVQKDEVPMRELSWDVLVPFRNLKRVAQSKSISIGAISANAELANIVIRSTRHETSKHFETFY